MAARKFVVDTCSLVNFFKYHYFDKKHGGQINKALIDFIVGKVMADEILIIDKVDAEAQTWPEYGNIRARFVSKIIGTDHLSDQIMRLSNSYVIKENEEKIKSQSGEVAGANIIDIERSRFENKYADLFLIAYCNSIKNGLDEVVLITEETHNRESQKLYPKLPVLCDAEHINWHDLSYLLFENYRKQLKFSLEIVP